MERYSISLIERNALDDTVKRLRAMAKLAKDKPVIIEK
jgi:hypothetical protein